MNEEDSNGDNDYRYDGRTRTVAQVVVEVVEVLLDYDVVVVVDVVVVDDEEEEDDDCN